MGDGSVKTTMSTMSTKTKVVLAIIIIITSLLILSLIIAVAVVAGKKKHLERELADSKEVKSSNPPSDKDPIVQTVDLDFIESPIILKEDWKSAPRFPGGSGFVAQTLQDRLIIWGGAQRSTKNDGKFYRLPSDVVYTFELPSDSHKDGVWNRLDATGEVHPGFLSSASAVLDGKIFIFGGNDGPGFSPSDSLSTLTSSGSFKRLSPKGEIPSPRSYPRGFSHGGKIYFLGGKVNKKDDSRKDDFVAKKGSKNQFFTNDLYQYDPNLDSFKRLSTTGDGPTPRSKFAIATLGDRVFVHGGWCNERLNDFRVLDMKTLEWTKIKETGFSSGIWGHSLSPISASQMLLVGGRVSDGGVSTKVSKEVKIFDATKLKWKDEDSLPANFHGRTSHEAVTLSNEEGANLICIGGYISTSGQKSNQIAAFKTLCRCPKRIL